MLLVFFLIRKHSIYIDRAASATKITFFYSLPLELRSVRISNGSITSYLIIKYTVFVDRVASSFSVKIPKKLSLKHFFRKMNFLRTLLSFFNTEGAVPS